MVWMTSAIGGPFGRPCQKFGLPTQTISGGGG